MLSSSDPDSARVWLHWLFLPCTLSSLVQREKERQAEIKAQRDQAEPAPRLDSRADRASRGPQPRMKRERAVIYISSLAQDVTLDAPLRRHFGQYGRVVRIVVKRGRWANDGRGGSDPCNGSATITFASEEDARVALEKVRHTAWRKDQRKDLACLRFASRPAPVVHA